MKCRCPKKNHTIHEHWIDGAIEIECKKCGLVYSEIFDEDYRSYKYKIKRTLKILKS